MKVTGVVPKLYLQGSYSSAENVTLLMCNKLCYRIDLTESIQGGMQPVYKEVITIILLFMGKLYFTPFVPHLVIESNIVDFYGGRNLISIRWDVEFFNEFWLFKI